MERRWRCGDAAERGERTRKKKEIKSDLQPEQSTLTIYVNNLGKKSITMQNKCCTRSTMHIDASILYAAEWKNWVKKRNKEREREQQQLYWQLFDRICSRIRRMHCIRHLCHLAFCFTIWATINTKHICSHIKPKRYRVRARFSLTVRCVCVLVGCRFFRDRWEKFPSIPSC